MKISLTNKTKYRDDDLRALARSALAHTGVETQELRLYVRTQPRGRFVNGRANCRLGRRKWISCGMWLYPKSPDRIDIDRFKKTIIHEAMHLAGAKHHTMTEEQRYCTFELPEWAKLLPLRVKEPKPKADPAERRAAERADNLEHAQAMLAKAATRRKRAATIEKKWATRVRRLQRAAG